MGEVQVTVGNINVDGSAGAYDKTAGQDHPSSLREQETVRNKSSAALTLIGLSRGPSSIAPDNRLPIDETLGPSSRNDNEHGSIKSNVTTSAQPHETVNFITHFVNGEKTTAHPVLVTNIEESDDELDDESGDDNENDEIKKSVPSIIATPN